MVPDFSLIWNLKMIFRKCNDSNNILWLILSISVHRVFKMLFDELLKKHLCINNTFFLPLLAFTHLARRFWTYGSDNKSCQQLCWVSIIILNWSLIILHVTESIYHAKNKNRKVFSLLRLWIFNWHFRIVNTSTFYSQNCCFLFSQWHSLFGFLWLCAKIF